MPVGKDGRWYDTDIEADYAGTQYDQDNRQAWSDITSSSASMFGYDNEKVARQRAEEDRREAEREAARAEDNAKIDEAKWAIEQFFELSKSGNIDEAINLGLKCVRKKKENKYLKDIVWYVAGLCYLNGRYKEAISCGDVYVKCLSYEKLGDEKNTVRELCYVGLGIKSKYLFSDKASFWFLGHTIDTPFNIEIDGIPRLIIEKAEKGYKSLFEKAGLIYTNGDTGVNLNKEKGKEFFDKVREDNEERMRNNDKEVYYEVGCALLYGNHLYEKNKSLGMEYIKKAIKLGNVNAKEFLKNRRKSLIFKCLGFIGYDNADDNSVFLTYLLTFLYTFSAIVILFFGIKTDFPAFPINFSTIASIFSSIIPFFILFFILKILVMFRHIVIIAVFSLLTLLCGIGFYNAHATNWGKFFPTPITKMINSFIPEEVPPQNNALLKDITYMENGVQKTVMIKNRWNNQVGTGIAGTPLLKKADGRMNDPDDRVKILKKGDILTVTGKPTNKRVPVEHEGVKGFVPIEFIGLPEK